MRPALRQAWGNYIGNTATKIKFPSAAALINDNNKAFICADNSGYLLSPAGTEVEATVYYPKGEPEEFEDIPIRAQDVAIMASGGLYLNKSGRVDIADTPITIAEYNNTSLSPINSEWAW